MKTIKLILLFASVALIANSCSNSTSPNPNNKGFASAPYTNATKISFSASNLNQADSSSQTDSLKYIVPKMPGFGGFFFDQSGQLNVYLTNPSQQKATVISVLSNWKPLTKLLSRRHTSVTDMKVLKGRYTLLQLQAWKSKIPVIDGVYEIGIDQSKNKVSIGVKGKAVKNEIIKKLTQLNIPKNAVAIFKMSQAVPL